MEKIKIHYSKKLIGQMIAAIVCHSSWHVF
jgi:hypothetical protein